MSHTSVPVPCRLCLAKGNIVLLNMFNGETDNVEAYSVPFCKRVELCLQIQVQANDALPNVVCLQCVYNVNRYYLFKLKAEQVANLLQSIMQPQWQHLDMVPFAAQENGTNSEFQDSQCTVTEDDGPVGGGHLLTRKTAKKPVKDIPAMASGQTALAEPLQTTDILAVPENAEKTTDLQNCRPQIARKKTSGMRQFAAPPVVPLPAKDTESSDRKKEAKEGQCLEQPPKQTSIESRKQCEVCLKTYASNFSLRRHMRVHSDGKMPYACALCDRSFMDSAGLASHRYEHNTNNPVFKCGMCLATFTQNVLLSQHLQTVHGPVRRRRPHGQGSYVCGQCSLRFHTLHQLHMHMDVHIMQSSTTAMCRVCQRTFHNKASLAVHETSCHHYQPFTCDYCDHLFPSREAFEVHIKQYHKQKPYPCSSCDRRFLSAYTLKVHSLKHDAETCRLEDQHSNLHCEICGCGFVHCMDLQQHKQVYHIMDNSDDEVTMINDDSQ